MERIFLWDVVMWQCVNVLCIDRINKGWIGWVVGLDLFKGVYL